MSEEEKDTLLITLQGDTNKLIDAIMAKANQ
jgi:DNA-binding CsgD family transcriptional regulator